MFIISFWIRKILNEILYLIENKENPKNPAWVHEYDPTPATMKR